MKKAQMKNYVILGCIYLIAIFLVFYLVRWYKAYQEYQLQVPVIRDVLQELLPDEVEHYLLEEPDATLYLCAAAESSCRDFEKDFRYYVKQKGLESTLVYVNLTEIEDKENYLLEFGKKYGKTIEDKEYPILLQFEDGIIKEQAGDLTLEKAKEFLKGRGHE